MTTQQGQKLHILINIAIFPIQGIGFDLKGHLTTIKGPSTASHLQPRVVTHSPCRSNHPPYRYSGRSWQCTTPSCLAGGSHASAGSTGALAGSSGAVAGRGGVVAGQYYIWQEGMVYPHDGILFGME
ncbi:MAG: hypothetical protein RIC35_08435 [Marinoscillum sp.]